MKNEKKKNKKKKKKERFKAKTRKGGLNQMGVA